jgi:hypothetical protein
MTFTAVFGNEILHLRELFFNNVFQIPIAIPPSPLPVSYRVRVRNNFVLDMNKLAIINEYGKQCMSITIYVKEFYEQG